MGTTIVEPPKVERPGAPALGHSGDGGDRVPGPQEGQLRGVQDRTPAPSKTGIFVLLAAIAMTFAAFTSALVVRQGSAADWRHLVLPQILYFNTLVLLFSSVTLEFARRRIAVFMAGTRSIAEVPTTWMYATFLLGLVFIAGQYVAWLQLRSQGLYLATNPNSSFFYLLTAIHALHVFGGMAGLIYVMVKLKRLVLRHSTLDSFAYYWHFMGILWVYLLLLLWMRL